MDHSLKKPIRVAHVIDHLGLGGAQRVLAVLLPNLPMECFPTTVYSLRGGETFADDIRKAGAKVVIWPRPIWQAPLTMLRFIRAIRRGDYDILHLHLAGAQFFWGFARPFLPKNIKVVIHEHSRLDRKNKFEDIAFRLARHPHTVIACSDAIREQCCAFYPLPSERCITLYNAVNLPDIDNATPTARSDFAPESEDKKLIGFTGRLNTPKGLDVLLDAWVDVVKTYPEVHLALIGDGPLKAELQAQAADLEIQSSITFCGYRSDVPGILKSLDAYAQPSRWEAFGLSMAEAMSARLPVVASDIPGIREVVVHNSTGILVPPEDPVLLAQAICALLADPNRAREMGQAGRQRVETHFNAATAAQKLARIYEKLAE